MKKIIILLLICVLSVILVNRTFSSTIKNDYHNLSNENLEELYSYAIEINFGDGEEKVKFQNLTFDTFTDSEHRIMFDFSNAISVAWQDQFAWAISHESKELVARYAGYYYFSGNLPKQYKAEFNDLERELFDHLVAEIHAHERGDIPFDVLVWRNVAMKYMKDADLTPLNLVEGSKKAPEWGSNEKWLQEYNKSANEVLENKP